MTAAKGAQYAALYAPRSEDLRRLLPDVAENLHGQLCELSARPTLDGCDRLSASLGGAQTGIRKLRESLEREGRGDGSR